MNTQPEALRLADELDVEFAQGRISNHNGRKAAAELRRLQAVNKELLDALKDARTQLEDYEVELNGDSYNDLKINAAIDNALAEQSAQRQEFEVWMKPHPKCDGACLYQCTKGFTQFPECATSPPASKPLADEEMRTEFESWVVHTFGMEFNQFEKSSDGTYLRGLVREYWGCWKAAHGIKGDA